MLVPTTGENRIVLDFFMRQSQSSKISVTKMKRRLTLLDSIIRIADADGNLLSNSEKAKSRLFAHFDVYHTKEENLLAENLDGQSEGSTLSMAGTIVKALNLNDDRVARWATFMCM